MYKPTVLTVDDDQAFCGLLRASLEKEGYQVLSANTTEEAQGTIHEEPVDMVLLDVRIPSQGGIDFCKWVRGESRKRDIPVMMLSVLRSEDDKVRGLDAGADDYLSKPVSNNVLLARMHALLRRTGYPEGEVQAGNLTINLDIRQAKVEGSPIVLSPKEFDVLSCFIHHRDKLLTRHALYDMAWGADHSGTYDRIDKYIRILRKKLGSCAHYIQTVWGLGYRFQVKNDLTPLQ